MSVDRDRSADWLWLLRRYLGVSLVAHLGWETLQLPLYTLWSTATLGRQAFAVVHCTLGDLIIAGLSLLLALALFARATWPRESGTQVYLASLAFGIGYTIYSEWLNVNVRGSWPIRI